MHPRLAPGLHVLRRGDGRLQVGLDRDRAPLLPDTPSTRHDLARLAAGELPDGLVPAEVRGLLRVPPPDRAGRVSVDRFGHPAGHAAADRVADLLRSCHVASAAATADVAVLVGAGEPDRALSDAWSQRGTPHVVVRFVEGYAVVGPFVVPGRTACLRCIDAAATDEDPSWPLLLDQYVTGSARDRRDGLGEPVDPTLAELACAWAARDVLTYLEGDRPSTWSATLRLDPRLHDLQTTSWLRHPACGCTWTMVP
jgi:bacteriocin biosynthesis cyclodehydratase domain-containing protein